MKQNARFLQCSPWAPMLNSVTFASFIPQTVFRIFVLFSICCNAITYERFSTFLTNCETKTKTAACSFKIWLPFCVFYPLSTGFIRWLMILYFTCIKKKIHDCACILSIIYVMTTVFKNLLLTPFWLPLHLCISLCSINGTVWLMINYWCHNVN